VVEGSRRTRVTGPRRSDPRRSVRSLHPAHATVHGEPSPRQLRATGGLAMNLDAITPTRCAATSPPAPRGAPTRPSRRRRAATPHQLPVIGPITSGKSRREQSCHTIRAQCTMDVCSGSRPVRSTPQHGYHPGVRSARPN
jgi:hypothetical protein